MENTENTLKEFIIKRDKFPPIKFFGELICVRSSRNHNSNRWSVLALYKTKGGKYVIERTHMTIWDGERNYTEAQSFDTAAEVIEWLKDENGEVGSLSQELIESAAKDSQDFADNWIEKVD
jgi:hypothetical protein